MRLDDHDKALTHFAAVIDHDGPDLRDRAAYSRGSLLFRLKRYGEAVEDLSRHWSDPELAASAPRLLAAAYANLGEYARAQEIYRQMAAAAAGPLERAEHLLAEAEIANRQGRHADAFASCEELIGLDFEEETLPEERPYHLREKAWFLQAESSVQVQDFPRAFDRADAGLRAFPGRLLRRRPPLPARPGGPPDRPGRRRRLQLRTDDRRAPRPCQRRVRPLLPGLRALQRGPLQPGRPLLREGGGPLPGPRCRRRRALPPGRVPLQLGGLRRGPAGLRAGGPAPPGHRSGRGGALQHRLVSAQRGARRAFGRAPRRGAAGDGRVPGPLSAGAPRPHRPLHPRGGELQRRRLRPGLRPVPGDPGGVSRSPRRPGRPKA